MGAAKRIYKNTLYLGVAEVVSKVLQFIVMLYAARLLSPNHFGKFSFAISLSLIAVIFSDIGINTLLIREISRQRKLASKYFMNAFVVKSVLSVFTFLLIVVLLNLMNYPVETRGIVYVIWIFTILSTFTELFYSLFRAFEKMYFDAFLKILRMVILTLLGLYVLFNGLGIFAFVYTFVITEVIVLVVASMLAVKNFIKLKFEVSVDFIKELIRKSMPFGLAFIFGSIYFYIDSVMLSKLRGDVEVAIYSVAYNLVLALLFIPTVYTSAIYPVLSRYYESYKKDKSNNEIKVLYTRSFKYLLIIGLPISVGLFMLSGKIIHFLYGTKYSASIIALQIVAWFVFIKFVNFLLGIVLSSINKQKKRMIGQGVTAFFNVVLNIFLIPVIGFVGAAISTLITEIFLFLIYFWFVSRNFYYFNFVKVLWKPVIGCIAMFFVLNLVDIHLIYSVMLGGFVYLVCILILGVFDKRDFNLVRKIL